MRGSEPVVDRERLFSSTFGSNVTVRGDRTVVSPGTKLETQWYR